MPSSPALPLASVATAWTVPLMTALAAALAGGRFAAAKSAKSAQPLDPPRPLPADGDFKTLAEPDLAEAEVLFDAIADPHAAPVQAHAAGISSLASAGISPLAPPAPPDVDTAASDAAEATVVCSKPQQPQGLKQKKVAACRFFPRGRCRKGAACPFRHDPALVLPSKTPKQEDAPLQCSGSPELCGPLGRALLCQVRARRPPDIVVPMRPRLRRTRGRGWQAAAGAIDCARLRTRACPGR